MSDIEDFIRSQLGETATPFEYQVNRATRTGWKRCDVVEPGNYDSPDKEFAETHWRAFREKDIRLFSGKRVYRIGPDTYADFWGHGNGIPPTVLPDPATAPPTCSQIFAMPGMNALEIIEFCKVGSHNADPGSSDDAIERMREWLDSPNPNLQPMREHLLHHEDEFRRHFARRPHGPQPWRMVRDAMADVMKIVPFEIQGADEAGLTATFLQPVNSQQALAIANLIIQVNTDAIEMPIAALESRGLPVPMDAQNPDMPDYQAAMTESLVKIGQFHLWWD